MSRTTEITQNVKRLLNQYNYKTVNVPEIFYAINRVQREIAIKEDVIEYEKTITIVDGTKAYNLSIGTAPNELYFIKKIRSIQFPSTWTNVRRRDSAQFDQEVQDDPNLSFVAHYTIRNKQIVFHGTPGAADDGLSVVLQTFLNAPTVDADDTNEPETPPMYDVALGYYAAHFLLPLENPGRGPVLLEFNNEISKFSGEYFDDDNAKKSPDPNW